MMNISKVLDVDLLEGINIKRETLLITRTFKLCEKVNGGGRGGSSSVSCRVAAHVYIYI